MRHLAKKGLIVISLIFSLSFFQTSYAAMYGAGAIVAEIGVSVGAIGAIFVSIASSLNARSSVEGSVTPTPGTTLKLYENVSGTLNPISTSQDIVLKKAPATQTFVYKNSGNSNWLNPSVSWQTMFDDPDPIAHPTGSEYYVALTNNTCNSLSSIAPGGSCSFNLVTYHDHPGDWGIIKATGDNLLGGTQFKNVLANGGLEITINLNTAEYHLGYRSIKLTNTLTPPSGGGNGAIYINSITPGGNLVSSGDIKYCSPTDSDCAYPTTCTISSSTPSLMPGQSCLIWFKAQSKQTDNVTDIPLQTISEATGRLFVGVEGKKTLDQGTIVDFTGDEKDSTFRTSYDKSLYAGGTFDATGDDTILLHHIAKWDGTDWSALGLGANDTVFAITSMKGDLYAGGSFTSAGEDPNANHIARWDGASWLPLGSGMNNNVHVLASTEMDLYVGGSFSSAGGVLARSIAKWNGSSWSALGSPTVNGTDGYVVAIAIIGTNIYAGGNFTIAGTVASNNIAKWNQTDGWSVLGSPTNGTNGVVSALASVGTNLYVGGSFTTAGEVVVNKIAQWDSIHSSWSELLGIDSVNFIAALNNGGGDLYAGGNFSVPGASIAKWSVLGSSWSALASGTSGEVKALASMVTNSGIDLYAGGNFNTPGNNIAKWGGESWSALGSGLGIINVSVVQALAIAPALNVTGYYWPGT